MLATIVWTMLIAGEPVAKLPPQVGKEMTAAIVAVNKALGLESWIVPGQDPCVDRGGLEATIKDISAEDTQQCAWSVLEKGFPGLGKDYWIGIPMADIGPVTVFAIGTNDAEGWGAYSCDPSRKCNPTKLTATSKFAKRLAERYRRACQEPRTVWFPNREDICADIPMNKAQDPAPSSPPVKADPSKAKPAPSGSSSSSPWPVKK
jgi:hypothetical protein